MLRAEGEVYDLNPLLSKPVYRRGGVGREAHISEPLRHKETRVEASRSDSPGVVGLRRRYAYDRGAMVAEVLRDLILFHKVVLAPNLRVQVGVRSVVAGVDDAYR